MFPSSAGADETSGSDVTSSVADTLSLCFFFCEWFIFPLEGTGFGQCSVHAFASQREVLLSHLHGSDHGGCDSPLSLPRCHFSSIREIHVYEVLDTLWRCGRAIQMLRLKSNPSVQWVLHQLPVSECTGEFSRLITRYFLQELMETKNSETDRMHANGWCFMPVLC